MFLPRYRIFQFPGIMRRIVIMSILNHHVITNIAELLHENMNAAALHENMTKICIGVTMNPGILAGIMNETMPMALPLHNHIDMIMHHHIAQDEL